jgi:hypothetical protein
MKTIFNLILMLGLTVSTVWAQDDGGVPPPMPAAPILSAQQLDQLLGPIALYPDPLIAVMLPAATQPSQIVMADRYVQNGGDPNAIEQQPWDPNVQGLAHYPAVLQWMDDNLNWTTQLGQAFQNQQQDVMDSIQRLRLMAYNLGNLQSTPQQQVVNDNGYIEIIPVSPSNVYVPDYQPDQVYYQPPSGPPYIVFSVGYVIGPWLCCDFDWHNRRVVYWTHNHPRPNNWWHYTPQQRNYYVSKHTTVWNPGNHTSPGFQGDRGWNNQNFGNPYPGNQNNRTWTAPIVNRPAPAPTLGGHPQPTLSGHPQPVFGGYNNTPNQYQTGNGYNQGNWNGNGQNVNHPAPAPNQWNQQNNPQNQDNQQNNQRSANNAFIGIQSAQDTRDYSQRGQESTQTGGHSASPSGGGNNGGTSRGSGGGNSGGGGGGSHASGGGSSSGGGNNNRH